MNLWLHQLGTLEYWQTLLELDKNGDIKESLLNFFTILRHDKRLQEICYNELSCAISVRNDDLLPWEQIKPGWSDSVWRHFPFIWMACTTSSVLQN
jgi:hypothetical protein